MSTQTFSPELIKRIQALTGLPAPQILDSLSFTYEGIRFHVHGVLHGISGGILCVAAGRGGLRYGRDLSTWPLANRDVDTALGSVVNYKKEKYYEG